MLVLFGFVLAILSKPMVITLPVVMILLDYWPLKRFESKKDNLIRWQLKEKMPFFVLSIIIVIITFYIPNEQEASIKGFPFYSRLANAPVAFVTYLAKTFWPHNLAVFYPFAEHLSLWQVLVDTLLIIIISATVIVTAKRLPYLFMGWLWFAITILPIIGIKDFGANFSMADRYHYLPSIGIAVMLAWGIPLLITHRDMRKIILFPAVISFLAIMSVLVWKQCGYWRSDVTLWNRSIRVTNNNYMAHNNLADALLQQGNTDKAVYHYNKAIAINDYAPAHYNKGVICFRQGKHQQAIMNFHEAIRVKPNYAEAYYNMGIIYHSSGQYQQAMENYNEAIRMMPNHIKAYNNRAFVYLNTGNSFAGCRDAQKACDMGNCQTLMWAKSNKLCN